MSEHQIPDDLKARYDKCCHPDEPEYSAWECTLIERIAEAEAERDLLRQNHPFGAMYDALQKLQAENTQLRAALDRMQQPVTVPELKKHGIQGLSAVTYVKAVNALLAARAAGKGE